LKKELFFTSKWKRIFIFS